MIDHAPNCFFASWASDLFRPMLMLLVAEAARATRRWGDYAGVRAWRVNSELQSLIHASTWMQPIRPATCWTKHSAPDPQCTCGYYACLPEAANQIAEYGYMSDAVGIVEPRGRVVRHEWGWRAECVIIREVWVPASVWGLVDRAKYPGVTWHRIGEGWV